MALWCLNRLCCFYGPCYHHCNSYSCCSTVLWQACVRPQVDTSILNAYKQQHKRCYETLPHDEPSCAATTFLRQATFLYPCIALTRTTTRAMQQPGRLCVHGRVSRARISAYMAMTLGFRCRIKDTDFVHASSHQSHIPPLPVRKPKTIGEEAQQQRSRRCECYEPRRMPLH